MSRKSKRKQQKGQSNIGNWLQLLKEMNSKMRNFTIEESEAIEKLHKKKFKRRKLDF